MKVRIARSPWAAFKAGASVNNRLSFSCTTVRHVLRELDAHALEAAFRAHGQALLAAHGEAAGRCIAIDGKVLRGRFDHFADPRAAPRLGALAQTEPIMVAHVPIAADSNEIPAAQPLIAELEQAGCLLTAGCGAWSKKTWLNMDSSQPCQEHAEERLEQSLALYPRVVHELEASQVQR